MTKIKIAIKNRWTGDIIFEYEKEGNTMAETINEYVRQALAKYERANLTDANLTDADLTDADLTDANLTDADLTRADLRIFKNDMFIVLLTAIPEIANLKKAIKEGKIDGSTYTGECACLAGTLMKCSNPEIRSRVDRLKDSSRPIERWFMMIKPGHTPENNQAAKLALEWIEEFEGYIAFLMPETLNQ